MKHISRKTVSTFILLISVFYCLTAQIPANYYSTAEGKTGALLKTALFSKINSHTALSYDNLWTAFQTTDVKTDGKVWDMYSNCTFIFGTNQDSGSGGGSECQFYNREHSMPNSWFSAAYPMYSDIFHLYPTDKYVNNQRGNYPFGETTSPTKTFGNGSKLGPCTFAGYTSTVFEPIDEYKGDFARTYFYMVTCYEDKVANWTSDQLGGNTYPALSLWSVNLFLKWHRNDPVSQKEIDRNNIIYTSFQHNRNPYIDYPALAEYVWGTNVGQAWSSTASGVEATSLYFQLSPNPAKNYLTISGNTLEGGTYVIYNLSGQRLLSGTLSVESQTISVEQLNNGMYLLEVRTYENQRLTKFIVNK